MGKQKVMQQKLTVNYKFEGCITCLDGLRCRVSEIGAARKFLVLVTVWYQCPRVHSGHRDHPVELGCVLI